MESIYSVVGFFQKGGLFMYPILVVFAVGMAIAVERWIQLTKTRSENSKAWTKVHTVLTKGSIRQSS